ACRTVASQTAPPARRGSALGQRLDAAPRRAGVPGPWPDQPIVPQLLDDVRAPPGDSRHDKDRRVERHFQVEAVIEARRRPVEVRMEALLGQDDALDDVGSFLPAQVAGGLGGLAGVDLEDAGSFIAGLVDTMTEAHDAFLAGQGSTHPLLRP